jgi:hypothetical protein
MYRAGANQIGFSSNGTTAATIGGSWLGYAAGITSYTSNDSATLSGVQFVAVNNAVNQVGGTLQQRAGMGMLIYCKSNGVTYSNDSYINTVARVDSPTVNGKLSCEMGFYGSTWYTWIGLGNDGVMQFNGLQLYLPNTALQVSSDDRLKTNEVFITNSLNTLSKLRPQTYTKHYHLATDSNYNSNNTFFEAGIIAQEVFYTCPELRHLIVIPDDADSNALFTIPVPNSEDPQIDPVEYNEYWGTKPASVNYLGLIPYMVQGIKELNDKNMELTAQNVLLTSNITSLEARLTAAGF